MTVVRVPLLSLQRSYPLTLSSMHEHLPGKPLEGRRHITCALGGQFAHGMVP